MLYLGLLNDIDKQIKGLPLEEAAKRAHLLRNEAANTSRRTMRDINAKDRLPKKDNFNTIYKKTQEKGYVGNDIYREIIESSKRSNIRENRGVGITND